MAAVKRAAGNPKGQAGKVSAVPMLCQRVLVVYSPPSSLPAIPEQRGFGENWESTVAEGCAATARI